MRQVIFLLIVAISMGFAEARVRQREKLPHRKRTPAPLMFDIATVNDAATRATVSRRAKGDAVLRAQILLDRAHFSVGEIDGVFGATMEDAVRSYQTAHRLPPDGVIKPEMWQTLGVDTAPALISYTITPQDTAGPFAPIPAAIPAQSKLPFLGYQSPLEELGERFHTSPKVLTSLNPAKKFGNPGEQITVPNIQRTPFVQAAATVVVKHACTCVEVLDDGQNVLAHYPASIGSIHDPLPLGDWKLEKPFHNPVFHYNPELFWDAKQTNPKKTLHPGPNNPVGLVWIPLTKNHYGIHGTPEPSTVGKRQSHGCIRLTNWDVSELANLIKPGMTASLREN